MSRFWFKKVILLYFFVIIQSQENLGPCTCDLTRNSCDLDCCCDPDCTSDDRQRFSTCITTYKNENPLSCSQPSVLFRASTPYVSNATSSNLFCVYFDRYTSRNYYVTPSIDASSEASVSAAVTTYATTAYSFDSVTSGLDPASVRNVYKTNVPVQVMYTNSSLTGFLAHPRPSNSPACSYASPALFLDSTATQCPRLVTNSSCTTDSAISLATFVLGFGVARQPTLLNSNNPNNSTVSVQPGTVTCQDAAGAITNCTSNVPPTNFSSGICFNVLTNLTYKIQFNSETGITNVTYDADLVAASLTNNYNLMQTFTFKYSHNFDVTDVSSSRSGNPGYLAGLPLIALIAGFNRTRLNLPGINADGSCSTDNRTTGQAVLFGENLYFSCSRSLVWNNTAKRLATSCNDLNNQIIASLSGLGLGKDPDTFLATFGNSSTNLKGDWLRVIVTDCGGTIDSTTTACRRMILGARLDLLVAKAGSQSNPQNKLIGAQLSCDTGPIYFQCAAGSCDASSTATTKFLTTYKVRFIDVSGSLLEGAKQRPVYLLRLPTDFFYPLLSHAASIEPMRQLWLICLTAACIAILTVPELF